MSFDINPPNRNLSNVQASAKSCAGGGGNTGYFRRDGGSEEDEVNLSFAKDYENDSFVKEEILEADEDTEGFFEMIKRLFMKLVDAIKSLLIKK